MPSIERLDIYTAYIGYASGTANNVSISDSRIDDCFMGTSNGGKTTHISIKNTDIGELSMGGYFGTSKNTKILNSNITGDIAIGDTNSASNSINTLIETNNPNLVDRGKNTVVFNYLNEGLNRFKGQASQGLRIELIQEGTTLINTVVDEGKIVDTYLKEGNPNFSLAKGDKVLLNIYDANSNQLFSESMTIKDLIVSLPKPKVNEVSNKSTNITGYVKADSQVFILKENQKESDEGVLVSRANRDGYLLLYR